MRVGARAHPAWRGRDVEEDGGGARVGVVDDDRQLRDEGVPGGEELRVQDFGMAEGPVGFADVGGGGVVEDADAEGVHGFGCEWAAGDAVDRQGGGECCEVGGALQPALWRPRVEHPWHVAPERLADAEERGDGLRPCAAD